jgi:hypothetical protein
MLKKACRDKHSSLFGLFVSDEGKSFLTLTSAREGCLRRESRQQGQRHRRGQADGKQKFIKHAKLGGFKICKYFFCSLKRTILAQF